MIKDNHHAPTTLAGGIAAQQHHQLRLIVTIRQAQVGKLGNQIVSINQEWHQLAAYSAQTALLSIYTVL
jgi:hypothetical protein